jgi:hypothetical protein
MKKEITTNYVYRLTGISLTLWLVILNNPQFQEELKELIKSYRKLDKRKQKKTNF